MFASHRKKRKSPPTSVAVPTQSLRKTNRWQDETGSRRTWDYDEEDRFDDRRNDRKAPNEFGSKAYSEDRSHHRDRLKYEQYRSTQAGYYGRAPARPSLSFILDELFDEFDSLHTHMDKIEDRLEDIIRRQKPSFR